MNLKITPHIPANKYMLNITMENLENGVKDVKSERQNQQNYIIIVNSEHISHLLLVFLLLTLSR